MKYNKIALACGLVSSILSANDSINLIADEDRFFILPSAGYAITSMDSSWSVTPGLKDDIVAQTTNYLSLKAGKEKTYYRYFAEIDYVKWSNANTLYTLLGADYKFRNILNDYSFLAGPKLGYATFNYDGIAPTASGITYGVGLGVATKLYDYKVELLYSFMLNDLGSQEIVSSYTHTVSYGNQHMIGVGVNF